jgi:hypothetical protein
MHILLCENHNDTVDEEDLLLLIILPHTRYNQPYIANLLPLAEPSTYDLSLMAIYPHRIAIAIIIIQRHQRSSSIATWNETCRIGLDIVIYEPYPTKIVSPYHGIHHHVFKIPSQHENGIVLCNSREDVMVTHGIMCRVPINIMVSKVVRSSFQMYSSIFLAIFVVLLLVMLRQELPPRQVVLRDIILSGKVYFWEVLLLQCSR